MKFEYRAINPSDKTGRIETGILDATDFKDVLKQLLLKQLYPIEVTQVSHAGISEHKQINNLKKLQQKLLGVKGKSKEIDCCDSSPEMEEEISPQKRRYLPSLGPEHLIGLLAVLGIVLVLLTGK